MPYHAHIRFRPFILQSNMRNLIPSYGPTISKKKNLDNVAGNRHGSDYERDNVRYVETFRSEFFPLLVFHVVSVNFTFD